MEMISEWDCVACHKKHSQEFTYCCPECDSERESGDLEIGEDGEVGDQKVFVQINMCSGLVDEVRVFSVCPEVLDSSDESWENGIKVFELGLDAEN